MYTRTYTYMSDSIIYPYYHNTYTNSALILIVRGVRPSRTIVLAEFIGSPILNASRAAHVKRLSDPHISDHISTEGGHAEHVWTRGACFGYGHKMDASSSMSRNLCPVTSGHDLYSSVLPANGHSRARRS